MTTTICDRGKVHRARRHPLDRIASNVRGAGGGDSPNGGAATTRDRTGLVVRACRDGRRNDDRDVAVRAAGRSPIPSHAPTNAMQTSPWTSSLRGSAPWLIRRPFVRGMQRSSDAPPWRAHGRPWSVQREPAGRIACMDSSGLPDATPEARSCRILARVQCSGDPTDIS